VDVSDGKRMVALKFHTPIRCVKLEEDQPNSMIFVCPTLVDNEDRHVLGHLGKTYRTGEESMFGQKYSIKPGSRDVLGHELRLPIDSITNIHVQLRAAVDLAFVSDPQNYEPHYVVSFVFFRTV
jgi:hypothetical protein